MAHGLSCSVACGIFPDQGSREPISPALAGGFLTTEPLGKSFPSLLILFCAKEKVIISKKTVKAFVALKFVTALF